MLIYYWCLYWLCDLGYDHPRWTSRGVIPFYLLMIGSGRKKLPRYWGPGSIKDDMGFAVGPPTKIRRSSLRMHCIVQTGSQHDSRRGWICQSGPLWHLLHQWQFRTLRSRPRRQMQILGFDWFRPSQALGSNQIQQGDDTHHHPSGTSTSPTMLVGTWFCSWRRGHPPCHSRHAPDHLDLFCDGTGLDPATPVVRLVAWGVVLAGR